MTKRLLLSVVLGGLVLQAQPTPAGIGTKTAGMERQDGYLPFYWDLQKGRVLLEIARLNEDVLYFVSVGKGIGSVELGVDRGLGAGSAVIAFERVGPRVQVVQKNLDFRAPAGNAALQQGMEESFAGSILAALPIEAEEGGRLLVDATSLLVRDAVNLEGLLRRRNQGSFRLDTARSSIYLPKSKAFPRNTEIEATLTFASDNPGRLIEQVTPDPRSLTVRLHHSFLQPPDNGYKPRVADPRIAASTLRFKDYSLPHTSSPDVAWVRRWRLEKKDPASALSEPKQPIVYYLDGGIPEPIRTGMREGTLWWNKAFEAAGFKNAIQVKDPPPDMDPMDARFSYIFWVNRDERGFSVGGHFADPRTGEILVAKPRMDSHRIRTVSSYWQSYRPTSGGGGDDGDACAAFLLPVEGMLAQLAATARHPKTENDMVYLRQALVTAHEVGHTLGFGHNWNSSMNERASVMEYPTPRLKLTAKGDIDVSDAYQNDIGAFDIAMVRFSYTELPAEKEKAGLESILSEMRQKGLLFTPSTDPRWNRYDDLSGPGVYLRETMKQRQVLLARYGPAVLEAGEPYGNLRGSRLWMAYLHHRWAIDSGVKYIGGLYHNFAVKGEQIAPTEFVPAPLQRELLGMLLEAIRPANLALPEPLLASLTVTPGGRDIEDFAVSTGYLFDHVSAARTLSSMVIDQLLEPERAARLIALGDRQPEALTLPEVLDAVVKTTWDAEDTGTNMEQSLRRVAQRVALDAMMMLGAKPEATPEVKAVTLDRIHQLQGKVKARRSANAISEAHLRQAERDIARYLENPAAAAPKASALPQPPGAPLGAELQ